MMSIPPRGLTSLTTNSRFDSQLRSYVRDEYGSDVLWVRALARTRSPPWRARLRRWLASRRLRKGRTARTTPPATPSGAARPASAVESEPCSHLVTEDLGVGGGVEFLLCTACSAVLVVQGSRGWRIGSSGGEAGFARIDGSAPGPVGPDPACLEE